jgi:hypothetical protein
MPRPPDSRKRHKRTKSAKPAQSFGGMPPLTKQAGAGYTVTDLPSVKAVHYKVSKTHSKKGGLGGRLAIPTDKKKKKKGTRSY